MTCPSMYDTVVGIVGDASKSVYGGECDPSVEVCHPVCVLCVGSLSCVAIYVLALI